MRVGEHNIDVWCDRNGEPLGAPVLLSPDEVAELQETGSVTLTLAADSDT